MVDKARPPAMEQRRLRGVETVAESRLAIPTGSYGDQKVHLKVEGGLWVYDRVCGRMIRRIRVGRMVRVTRGAIPTNRQQARAEA